MMNSLGLGIAVVALIAAIYSVLDPNGARYQMAATDNGVYRLDTRTGKISYYISSYNKEHATSMSLVEHASTLE
jgi:hypothetical protein